MSELKIGEIVCLYGKIEEVIQKVDGTYYTVRVNPGITGDIVVPAMKVRALREEELNESTK